MKVAEITIAPLNTRRGYAFKVKTHDDESGADRTATGVRWLERRAWSAAEVCARVSHQADTIEWVSVPVDCPIEEEGCDRADQA